MSWCSGLEDICRSDVPLSEHTWYGLGGPARWFVTPRSEDELVQVLARCAAQAIPWRILGRGANVLVRDAGVDAAVIHLTGPAWDSICFEDTLAHVGGGADFTRVAKQAVERGLVGLENLAGIPGSMGGIIHMNAGGRYGSIAQYVRDAHLATPDGQRLTRSAAQLGFTYRHCALDGAIVTAVTLALQPGDREATLARFREIWTEKHATQPPVAAKSAGCIFKNPPGHAAGKLIDEAGLKGTRRGGAEISSRHANFIVAYPGARAQDVLDLITLAQERVYRATGLTLELEVELW